MTESSEREYLSPLPIAELVQAVRAAADPVSDKRGPRGYRVHLIGELSKRAALIAGERATKRLTS